MKAGGEGDNRGWDGCMASTQWRWVWVNSGSWRWRGRPGVLQSMIGLQRVGHDWAIELNRTERYSGFPGVSVVKNLLAYAGDVDLIPGLVRSPGEENGNLIQYSCLGNTMDRGAWWATVHESETTEQQQQVQLSFRVCLAFLQSVAPGSTIKEQRSVRVENVLETAQLQGKVGSSCTKMIRREKWRVELRHIYI